MPAFRFEGHAIVSADGMIAAGDGTMPPALRSAADWRLFQAALDRACVVVLGRHAHERHVNPGRRRLVVTSTVPAAAGDPTDPLATLWNPSGLPLDEVLARLAAGGGTVAVTGGTRVFDLFVPRYTSFVLSEVPGLSLPDGRPAFSAGHPRDMLAGAGLSPGHRETIEAGVFMTRWERSPRGDVPAKD